MILAGGAFGALAAFRRLHASGAPDAEPRQRSYYLTRLHPNGIAVKEMTPLLLTPLRDEFISPDCPERLVCLHGQDSYEEGIRAYVEAIGDLGLGADGFSGLAAEVARHLRHEWNRLRAVSSGKVSRPPLRILVKHYPRPELPGRCVTIQATFYDVPDAYMDRIDIASKMRAGAAVPVKGALLHLRRTYQLAGDGPRLIEALAEIHTHPGIAPPLRPVWLLLGEKQVGAIARDRDFGQHFMAYGAGARYGLCWTDRAFGLGDPAPFGAAYRILRTGARAGEKLEQAPLPPALASSLLRLVERA